MIHQLLLLSVYTMATLSATRSSSILLLGPVILFLFCIDSPLLVLIFVLTAIPDILFFVLQLPSHPDVLVVQEIQAPDTKLCCTPGYTDVYQGEQLGACCCWWYESFLNKVLKHKFIQQGIYSTVH